LRYFLVRELYTQKLYVVGQGPMAALYFVVAK
jgi:hypothetical protein